MNWTEFLTTEIENTYAVTVRLLNRVDPDSLNWKPASGTSWMTMGQLLQHMSNACGAGTRGLVKGDWGQPEGKSLEDLTPEEMLPAADKLPTVAGLDQARKALIDDESLAFHMIREAGEEALAHREVTVPWEPGRTRPLGFHVLKMVQHLDRHKSQLFYYLKLQGVPLGTTDLWG